MWTFFYTVHLVQSSLFKNSARVRNFTITSLGQKRNTVFLLQKIGDYSVNVNACTRPRASLFKHNFFWFFTKFFLRGGRSLKVAASIQWAFWKLYVSVFQNFEKKKKQFANFFFIFNMLRFNIDLFNINLFFSWLMRVVHYSFFFKICVLPRFLKKRTQSTYLIEPMFLAKKKRVRASLRIFSLGVSKGSEYVFRHRVLNSLVDLAFNFKKSQFFLEKSLVYLKIFKLLKKKKRLG